METSLPAHHHPAGAETKVSVATRWRPQLGATFTRTSGVRHMLAALNLSTGRMLYRIRARKRWREFLDLLKVLRRQWPTGRLYLIVDNFSRTCVARSLPGATATTWSWCSCPPTRHG